MVLSCLLLFYFTFLASSFSNRAMNNVLPRSAQPSQIISAWAFCKLVVGARPGANMGEMSQHSCKADIFTGNGEYPNTLCTRDFTCAQIKENPVTVKPAALSGHWLYLLCGHLVLSGQHYQNLVFIFTAKRTSVEHWDTYIKRTWKPDTYTKTADTGNKIQFDQAN